jgi:hypothetical protein
LADGFEIGDAAQAEAGLADSFGSPGEVLFLGIGGGGIGVLFRRPIQVGGNLVDRALLQESVVGLCFVYGTEVVDFVGLVFGLLDGGGLPGLDGGFEVAVLGQFVAGTEFIVYGERNFNHLGNRGVAGDELLDEVGDELCLHLIERGDLGTINTVLAVDADNLGCADGGLGGEGVEQDSGGIDNLHANSQLAFGDPLLDVDELINHERLAGLIALHGAIRVRGSGRAGLLG